MAIKSSSSICMVPQIKGGPWLFRDDLESCCRQSAQAGFDAVETLTPAADALDRKELGGILTDHNLQLSAVGTGAGYICNKLHLSSPDEGVRRQAVNFIKDFIELGSEFGAHVIIGSMKGGLAEGVQPVQAMDWLRAGLDELGQHAHSRDVLVVLEPLNRYETNFINRLDEGVTLLESLQTDNVKLLADLFHMNIEEESIATALIQTADHIGHVHFVDSNRRPPGCGHIDLAAVAQALRQINYNGYLSAEALAWPDSAGAAAQTMASFRKFFAK